jgi:hypothetical protein
MARNNATRLSICAAVWTKIEQRTENGRAERAGHRILVHTAKRFPDDDYRLGNQSSSRGQAALFVNVNV